MVSHVTSPWNHAVTYLETWFKDQILAAGSGFFWRFGDRSFLVSNWHNFSGRDPATGQPLRADGGVPDRIKLSALRKETEPDSAGFYEMRPVAVEVEICGEHWVDPRWLEHSTFKRQVDVAAIDVTDELKRNTVEAAHANLLEYDAVVTPHPSQDVFIVGYPLGLITPVPIPVWKRGTIATEPLFDPDGLPKIYVDTATRSGMSGSVVLARYTLFGPYKKADGSTVNNFYTHFDKILGIYSGRIGAHNIEAQLGIVWKRHLIDAVVSGGSKPDT